MLPDGDIPKPRRCATLTSITLSPALPVSKRKSSGSPPLILIRTSGKAEKKFLEKRAASFLARGVLSDGAGGGAPCVTVASECSVLLHPAQRKVAPHRRRATRADDK